MEIIDYIENELKRQNISAYKLCKDTGIKQTTFQNWKNGAQPRADILKKVVLYLNISADKVLETRYNKKDPTEDPDPDQGLTENEKELLQYFRKLPDREQIKEIGRIEDKAAAFQEQKQKYINSKGVS